MFANSQLSTKLKDEEEKHKKMVEFYMSRLEVAQQNLSQSMVVQSQ